MEPSSVNMDTGGKSADMVKEMGEKDGRGDIWFCCQGKQRNKYSGEEQNGQKTNVGDGERGMGEEKIHANGERSR